MAADNTVSIGQVNILQQLLDTHLMESINEFPQIKNVTTGDVIAVLEVIKFRLLSEQML
jgi:hypothetical protein